MRKNVQNKLRRSVFGKNNANSRKRAEQLPVRLPLKKNIAAPTSGMWCLHTGRV